MKFIHFFNIQTISFFYLFFLLFFLFQPYTSKQSLKRRLIQGEEMKEFTVSEENTNINTHKDKSTRK